MDGELLTPLWGPRTHRDAKVAKCYGSATSEQ